MASGTNLQNGSGKFDNSTKSDCGNQSVITNNGVSNDVQYPSGCKLFVIILALVTAVFLLP